MAPPNVGPFWRQYRRMLIAHPSFQTLTSQQWAPMCYFHQSGITSSCPKCCHDDVIPVCFHYSLYLFDKSWPVRFPPQAKTFWPFLTPFAAVAHFQRKKKIVLTSRGFIVINTWFTRFCYRLNAIRIFFFICLLSIVHRFLDNQVFSYTHGLFPNHQSSTS